MRIMALLSLIISFSALADICICQYPKEDARYGGGYKGEIAFYKMGCQIWHLSERKCRKKKTIDINESLEPYLDKHHRDGEKIRVGFVGHWSSSSELVDYLKNEIEPVRSKYKSPIHIENTACLSMDSPDLVSDYVSTLDNKDNAYLTVEGTQTTSIGMWDKVSFAFRKADLIASVDSRNSSPIYPKCSEFIDRRCTGFQAGEKGFCVNENDEKKQLICHGRIKVGKYDSIKIRKAKRWLDLESNLPLLKKYIEQQHYKLLRMANDMGLKPNYTPILKE